MDLNFNILQEIGDGPQGTVLLVEDKRFNKELYALKKVECKDEAEASQAFKEAMFLKGLSHPNVCSYQDMFVSWDDKDCAIYMCLVMEYYQNGDLKTFLRKNRVSQVVIDQTLVMKWVGQMVDGLVYVHKNKMIHRDLKPANVFMKGDQDLVIGDFSLPTLLASAQSVTNSSSVGAISWMAPEVLEGIRCDETADIYSFGTIVLEMASCSFLDYNEIHRVLFESKQDRTLLDDALEKVESIYDSGLVEVIRKCMRRAFKQRPTADQLCKLPYVQKCLKLCNSQLYKDSDGDSNSNSGDGEAPVPSTGGIDALLEYLRVNSTNLCCQLLGLRQLLKQPDLSDLSAADKQQILQGLILHKESGEVQQLSFQILAIHVATAELSKKDAVFSDTYISPVLSSVRFHCQSQNVVSSAMAFLMAIAGDEVAADLIGSLGGIQDVLAAIRKFGQDLEVVSNCVAIIWSLSGDESKSNMKLLTDMEAVRDVFLALDRHKDASRDLVEAACTTLWALSMNDENATVLAKLGAVDLLVKIITIFPKDAGIVRFSCSTLSSLVEVQEVSAHHVMQTEDNICGFSVMKNSADLLSSETQVLESVATLIQSLACYNTVREELLSLDAVSFLTKHSLNLSSDNFSDMKFSATTYAAITKALATLSQAKNKEKD